MKYTDEEIEKYIKEIDAKIKEIEEEELKDKPFNKKLELKQKWEKERLRIQKESQEKFDKKMEKFKSNKVPLQSIDDMKKEVNEFIKELDDKYNKIMEEMIDSINTYKDN